MAANQRISSSITSTPSSGMSEPQTTRPKVLGIHHLKFAVSNLSFSLAWYSRVLGASRIPSLDHLDSSGTRFAVVCEMPDWGGLCLELRENAIRALEDRNWDAVTMVVRSRKDLAIWMKWLDLCGTKHSGVLTGMRGWLVVFEDPDGRRIRIYTQEDHSGREKPSFDKHWLSDV